MTESQKAFIAEVIIPQLVEMAIKGKLPDDLNQLSAETFEKKTAQFNSSKEETRRTKIDRLSNFVCTDPTSAYESLMSAKRSRYLGDVVSLAEYCQDLGSITVNFFIKDYL